MINDGTYRHFDTHFDVGNFLSQTLGYRGQRKFTGWIHAVDWFGARHTCIHLMAEYTLGRLERIFELGAVQLTLHEKYNV